MPRIPSLPAVRDTALVAAAVAVTAMAIDELTDLLTGRRTTGTSPAGQVPPLAAPHGWLHRVDQFSGAVRPATPAEADAARAAAAVDGGDGVFGRAFDSTTVLLPDDPAYTGGGISYYRVVTAGVGR